MAQAKRCMSCMEPVPEGAAACPLCGYNGTQQNPESCLPIGTRLCRGRFIAGRVTEVFTDCVDYAGYDVKELQQCSIREYLPAGGCARAKGETLLQAAPGALHRYKEGLSEFLSLYGKLSDMPEGCALLRELDCFVQNGTAYAVFERFEGMTLRELLGKSGGTLTAEQTDLVLQPVLSALAQLHERGRLHRNVNPDTVLINHNGDIRLAGFAAGERTGAKSANGYLSPEEEAGEPLTPASDVYSAAAVYYRCVVGTVPQDALQRRNFDTLAAPAEVLESVPTALSRAVWLAMLVSPEKRAGSIAAFRRLLAGEEPEELQPQPEPEAPAPQEQAAAKRAYRWRLACILAASLLAVMAGVYLISRAVAKAEQARQEQDAGTETPAEATVEMPRYIGTLIADVEFDTLTFDYLLVSTYEEGKPADTVVGQEPQAGAALGREQRAVTLYVNRTKETTAILPDVRGLYYLNAEEQLEKLGISCTIVRRAAGAGEQPGLVVEQSAAPGSEYALLNPLVLTVAEKPAES